MCRACLLQRISSTFFMASTDFCHKSRSYLTGTFLLFSNSNDGSMARSLPEDLRNALVHLVLRGFFFFLNAFLHFDRQNLNIYSTNLINVCFYKVHNVSLPCSRYGQKSFHGQAIYLTNKSNTFRYAFCWKSPHNVVLLFLKREERADRERKEVCSCQLRMTLVNCFSERVPLIIQALLHSLHLLAWT